MGLSIQAYHFLLGYISFSLYDSGNCLNVLCLDSALSALTAHSGFRVCALCILFAFGHHSLRFHRNYFTRFHLYRLKDHTDLSILPDQTLLKIFSTLDAKTLCQISQVKQN